MTEHILESIVLLVPEIILIAAFCVIIVVDLLLKKRSDVGGWILIAAFVLSGIALAAQVGISTSAFSDMIVVDPFAIFFKFLLLISGIFVVLFSMQNQELIPYRDRISEYYMLVSGMMLGMFLMVSSTNLLMMYLSFEMASISSYVLVGFTKKSIRSAESSIKYIIFGSVSSGILIYGMSLIYGMTGTLNIFEIGAAMSAMESTSVFSMALLMIVTGIGFKIAIVPFHFWAPDVYEGAPITITALLAVASKIAAVAMMIRLFRVSFTGVDASGLLVMIPDGIRWDMLLAIMAAAAMILGNLSALWQDNIKRMLAYSSIAHAGYIMMGVVVLSDQGISAVMLYSFMYLFMNLGAFYVAMLFSNKFQTESIEAYKGLGFRTPFAAITLTIFLVSLTGLPPTAGFIAKLYIFGAAVNAGWIWLVLIAGIMTIVSLFYYIRIARNMFLYKPEGNEEPVRFDNQTLAVLILLLAPVLVLGVYFTPVLEFVNHSLAMFGF
jgi:NADH-quinone oxidoreductase subunit N